MAHKGTSTFIIQRASAVALIPLAIWIMFSFVSHVGADYETARSWAAKPLNGGLMALFAIIGTLHMRIGLMEIISDYFDAGMRSTLQIINWLIAVGVIASVLWSLYNISFAG